MRRLLLLLAVASVGLGTGTFAQARRGATPAPTTRTEAAQIQCPAPLGAGVQTRRVYCDVLTGVDPAEGIIVTIPPHTGPVTLTFDLHNRHLFSEELIKAGRGYRRYMASIGVLTFNNDLLSRFAILSEFRAAADLVERIAGDAGAAAPVKAVAPTGVESVRISIPAAEERVSILGEKLSVVRPDSPTPDSFSAPGRPIAVVSNVMVEYRPAPARPARRR